MKKLIIFGFIIIYGLLLISCDKDNINEDQEIKGEWNLVSYECCDLPKEEYNRNNIVWLIDPSAQDVKITNNVTIDASSQYNFKENGIYSLQLITNENIIIINYKDYTRTFDYRITKDTLTLGASPESDGPRLIFNK